MNNKNHKILVELLKLRDTDYDQFIEKLYFAVTTDFSIFFREEMLKEEEHRETIRIMIKHFEEKEEYEKCDVLLHILNNPNKLD